MHSVQYVYMRQQHVVCFLQQIKRKLLALWTKFFWTVQRKTRIPTSTSMQRQPLSYASKSHVLLQSFKTAFPQINSARKKRIKEKISNMMGYNFVQSKPLESSNKTSSSRNMRMLWKHTKMFGTRENTECKTCHAGALLAPM